MPNLRLLFLALLATLLAGSLNAAPRQWEALLEVADQEDQSDPSYQAGLRYYFDPLVVSSNAPWAELDFTGRIGYLEGSAGYQRLDWTGAGATSAQDITRYDVNFVHRKAESRHSLSAFFRNERYDSLRSSTVDAYGAAYDVYLQDDWTVGLAAETAEYEILPDLDPLILRLRANRLWSLSGEQWFGLEGAIVHETIDHPQADRDLESWLFQIEGRYYLNPRTGVTLGFKLPENDWYTETSLGLSHFFTEAAYLDLSVDLIDYDSDQGPIFGSDFDDSQSRVSAKLGFRF